MSRQHLCAELAVSSGHFGFATLSSTQSSYCGAAAFLDSAAMLACMMRCVLPLLFWVALLRQARADEEEFPSRIVATDLRFLWGSPREADDSPSLGPYVQQARQNIKYLRRRGVTIEEDWNIFQAHGKWGKRFGSQSAPGIILLVGVWNEEGDDEGAVSGRQFLGLAMESLKAQFPDAAILAVNAMRHLNSTMGPVGYVSYPLKEGHGIDMLRFPSAVPSREPLGLGMLATGETSMLKGFTVEARGLPQVSGAKEAFDIMAFLRAGLSAGHRILQLGGNRFQLLVAFLKYMDQHSWKPFKGLSRPTAPSPLPRRLACDVHERSPNTTEAVHSRTFNFPELAAARGSSPETVLAWLDAVPVGLLGQNTRNLSCAALRDELRRSRHGESARAPAAQVVARHLWAFPPQRWCTVYMGSSNGSHLIYREAAQRLGRLLARNGIGLVYGGSNAGLMGTVADAVLQEGGYVIGVRPAGNLLTAEHEHKNLSKMIFTKSMHERKQTMVDLADFLVALPGGLGTLDEVADAMVLAHLGTHSKRIYLLNTNKFWTPLLSLFETMEASSFLQPGRWARMVEVVDDVDRLMSKLQGTDTLTQWEAPFLPFEVALKVAGVAAGAGMVASAILALLGLRPASAPSNRRVADLSAWVKASLKP